MDITKYLRGQGYDTIDKAFYRYIYTWETWYRSNVRKFHSYKIYNGKTYVKQRRFALGMAKKICEDLADLLMNEKVGITAADCRSQEYIGRIFQQNHMLTRLNNYQERKAYTGTVAYIPYIDGAEADGGGYIRPGRGTVKINCISAPGIYPLSWENDQISECAFVSPRTIDSRRYAHIQIHALHGGEYVITNHIVENSSGSGQEMPYSRWGGLKGFESLKPEIYTGSSERQFVIDTLNIVNNIDEDNPMGVALFANCIDQVKGLDVIYDSYINEFVLGKKRIFVAPEMLAFDPVTGNPAFDENDLVFYQLPEDMGKESDPIKEVNMDIRAEAHNRAINDGLNILSSKCGFGTERYRFEKGSVATATQVISENSDLYRTLKKHEIPLEESLKELVRIICRLGAVLGEGTKEDAEITIDFDDSIIEDKTTERQQDRQDVSMGVMGLAEYRAKWYGETEEEAASRLPEQNVVME